MKTEHTLEANFDQPHVESKSSSSENNQAKTRENKKIEERPKSQAKDSGRGIEEEQKEKKELGIVHIKKSSF